MRNDHKHADKDIIAIIPARGGSKRIPSKNLLPMGGIPMLAYSILHATNSNSVKKVYVSTDDTRIADIARAYGAEVVWRPTEIADDTASSESALLHVLDERNKKKLPDPELVVFLQCTSPVRMPDDIDNAVRWLVERDADSLFSACESNRLIWSVRENGELYSLNYDFHMRQREQDMKIQYRENGSIYVFKPEILRKNENRLGGKIAVYPMAYWSSFQLDAPEHAELLQWLLSRPQYRIPFGFPERIDLVVFDFDGVMTDNKVHVDQDGRETVTCDRGDGWGTQQLMKAGIPALILSTEKNPVVAARGNKLGLPVHQGIGDKGAYLIDYLKKNGIDAKNVVYIGNDVNDLGCFEIVGVPVATADAHPDVLPRARLVVSRHGGQGAVRELCDLILAHTKKNERP